MRADPEGPIRFWKMSGAGNDFIVLPLAPRDLPIDPSLFVRRVCRRGVSIGADGVLFVTRGPAGIVAQSRPPETVPSRAGDRSSEGRSSEDRFEGRASADRTSAGTPDDRSPEERSSANRSSEGASPDHRSSTDRALEDRSADLLLVHYNADGGQSDFCGNGTRCAARFGVLMGLAASPLSLWTGAGIVRAEVVGEAVRIEVPPPSEPVPRVLEALGAAHAGWQVRAGVPHFVLQVADPAIVDLPRLGAALRSHPGLGAEGANVDFVGPLAGGRARMRTYERGVEGETLACGSGAIAAAAVLARPGVPSPIVLTPTSGIDLEVEFETGAGGTARRFRLKGEARIVFEGQLVLDEPAGGRRA